jgi:hypothetical protein
VSLDGLPKQGEETYLGDGLYASFDGWWHVKLRAARPWGDDVVALEPQVYRALQDWLNTYPTLKKHMEGAA